MSNGNDRVVTWIRIVSLFPLIVLVAAWVLLPGVRDTFGEGLDLIWKGDFDGVRIWARELGWWAPLMTGSLMIAQAIAAPVPAIMVTAANSFLFGPFWGGLYSILTANIAAAICYGVARGYGTMAVDALISRPAVEKYETFFRKHGMLTVLVARLVPVVPFDPISYVAGLVRMPFWPFFWATMLGQIPAGMAYSYLVQEMDRPSMFAVYAVCVVAALFLLGWLVRRIWMSEPACEIEDEENRERTGE